MIWILKYDSYLFYRKKMNLSLKEVRLDHGCGILDQINLKTKRKYE